jgi:heme-degrading monooxygenase HmoA
MPKNSVMKPWNTTILLILAEFWSGRMKGKLIQMILEVAILNVRPGQTEAFEAAFMQAAPLIAAIPGYISHELQKCLETPHRYILLAYWETVEAHTIGFRQSPEYQAWKKLLHHFYDPFPVVEHFESIIRL